MAQILRGGVQDMISRPVLRYQGGKWRIAPWIMSFFPAHKIYCESFGGAGNVLMRKPRSTAEIYNDNNSKIYGVFKLLRDRDKALELKRRLELTPWSRQEYVETDYIDESDDDIEIVRKTIVRAFMGLSAGSVNRGLCGFSSRIGKHGYDIDQTKAWQTYPPNIPAFTNRLRGVVLENRDALEVIKTYDTDKTMHYVDPPYQMGTWSKSDRNTYKTILTDGDHERLLGILKSVKGYVVLSGYDNEIYRDNLKDWHLEKKETTNQRNEKRTECVWISPRTFDALKKRKSLLEFE